MGEILARTGYVGGKNAGFTFSSGLSVYHVRCPKGLLPKQGHTLPPLYLNDFVCADPGTDLAIEFVIGGLVRIHGAGGTITGERDFEPDEATQAASRWHQIKLVLKELAETPAHSAKIGPALSAPLDLIRLARLDPENRKAYNKTRATGRPEPRRAWDPYARTMLDYRGLKG